MKKKDKLLIQLIRTVELDKPSPGFTEDVMDCLRTENSFIEEKNTLFGYNLNKDILPSLPDDFSTKTMHMLRGKEKKIVFKPLLSKRNGSVLISFFSIFYLFLWIDDLFLNIFHYSGRSLSTKVLFQGMFSIPPIFWMCTVALAMLLWLDYFIKKDKSPF
ncbi:hypothetical protein [Poritiphilus flavus]|uniref:Uncharacterized protein n=1 Tax=Poritiphilus flavus TaxID=2697053 RepID=A0A6L9EBM0_9FLAO|nr:hypothetical protein [Poritiphilus flavus]NAS12147.1 hypothetical protein [Poritiphilus flavus]